MLTLIQFLSTLSLRRATETLEALCNGFEGISIHALLAESDDLRSRRQQGPPLISIHALLAESDLVAQQRNTAVTGFLSTLSLRRATSSSNSSAGCCRYFYPRSPCGERRCPFGSRFESELISIHALLAESDVPSSGVAQTLGYFYPRSPCGERLAGPSGPAFLYNFYPRSPCGERRTQSASLSA